jgi:Zn-dependent protease
LELKSYLKNHNYALAYSTGALLLRHMLGWSMNLFRVRGIQLAAHFSFFVLLAVNAYIGWEEAGQSGLIWHTVAMVAFFTCVVLHELGHSFTAMHYGIGVRRILLMPIGGMAEFDRIPREPGRELWITVAGPAVNFVIAGVLWLVLPARTGGDLEEMTVVDFGHLVMTWNLLMGVFNLLPAFPMDGGRILRAILASRMNYLRATFWAVGVGKVLCSIGFVFAVFFEPMLVLLFGFIFFVGEMEYRALKRREIEDAQLRASLARLYPLLPPLDEPPLLTSSERFR